MMSLKREEQEESSVVETELTFDSGRQCKGRTFSLVQDREEYAAAGR